MPLGRVKWYNNQKGYGFIQPDEGGADVFIHHSAVQQSGLSSLEEGGRIEFEVLRDKRTGKSAAGKVRLLSDYPEVIVVNGSLVSGAATIGTSPGTRPLRDAEPQRRIASTFRTGPDGRIEFDPTVGVTELLKDAEAADRHSEAVRLLQEFIDTYDDRGIGANALRSAVDDASRLLDALGGSIGEIRPGLLIPRGEVLRQLRDHQRELDPDSTVPALPDRSRIALNSFISAYNALVALDPALALRDAARLDPEEPNVLIDKKQGVGLAASAVEAGVAAPSVSSIINEEARVLPSTPDPFSRRSRRFSESVRNLLRAIVSSAVHATNAARNTVKIGKVVVGASILVVGTSYGAAQWTLANEVQIKEYFRGNPTMLEVIEDLTSLLRSLPTK